MPERICPFNATLVKNNFGCQHAQQIIRRGGAEIACKAEAMHAECCAIHARIKREALEAMGLEDDLLTLPHSVLVKIQFGSLLALQTAMGVEAGKVDDIAGLISSLKLTFPDLDRLPFDDINTAINDYKMSRRGKK